MSGLFQTPFGPGTIYVQTGTGGFMEVANVQDFTFDIAKEVKELSGSDNAPIAVRTGAVKYTGKLKEAAFNGAVFNAVFFGKNQTATQSRISLNEAALVPAGTPYTVTVAQSAKFVTDLGIKYANGSGFLTQVASAPTVGQYSVTNGVYTFAAADAGKALAITYTFSSTSGVQIQVTSDLIGTTVTFAMVYAQVDSATNQQLMLQFTSVVAPKLALNFKHSDFTIPELDLIMFQDASKKVFTYNGEM